MGIPNTPVVYSGTCPQGRWPDLQTPDEILIVTWGISRTPSAPPSVPPFPDMVLWLPKLICNWWEKQSGVHRWDFESRLNSHGISLWWMDIPKQTHGVILPDTYEDFYQGVLNSYVDYYSNGYFMVWPCYTYPTVHPVWQVGESFGVPGNPGYFAEPFSTALASLKVRFASHIDKTNVKIYQDY